MSMSKDFRLLREGDVDEYVAKLTLTKQFNVSTKLHIPCTVIIINSEAAD